MQKLGWVLVGVSFLPWAAIPLVLPQLPITTTQKTLLIPALLVLAEILFWLGLLIVGKEAAQRYKQFFNFKAMWRSLKRGINRLGRSLR
ncbi:transporter suffix domain-containing protein [Trichocoleus sp. FACHB-591]|uniref:transporter suffix domain-containing protein n=1 Tax=Trichocoleus sp. FACHB-591 TaxID=2692872 RepID=UPI0016878DCC|nr:transporter suffix domain-containing protein [Trichocoleus sp. FACHB-591]MBD2098820.1 transporter suffix domain-containing protein [Trichocoleus sp. FACHB-591]